MRYVKTIKDPIHGYISLTELELRIVDSGPFQRLRRIRQLAGAEYVYPGAIHTRFEHSLGVMHLAGIAEERVMQYDPNVEGLLRLSGLLHDIGHGPFSHTFDAVVERFGGKSHEERSAWVIKESEIGDILSANYDPSEISDIIRGTHVKAYLSKVINSSADVDKMDFTVRDSYHTGAGYSVDIRRIAQNYSVIGGDLGIHRRALESVEALLMARLLSFRTIYYHKTSRAVQLMLEKGMELLIESGELDLEAMLNDVNSFLDVDDYTMWSFMKMHETSAEILKDIANRRIFKVAYGVNGVSLNEKELKTLKEELLNKTGIKEEDLLIDNPSMVFIKDKAIPRIFDESGTFSPFEVSPVLNRLRDIKMSVLRVYVRPEIRSHVKNRVKEVVNRFLGDLPSDRKSY